MSISIRWITGIIIHLFEIVLHFILNLARWPAANQRRGRVTHSDLFKFIAIQKKKKRKEKMVINKWENESNRWVGETEVLKKF